MTARRMPLFEQESCREMDPLLLLMRLRIEFIMVRPMIARHIEKHIHKWCGENDNARLSGSRTEEQERIKKKGYMCE